MSRSVFADFGLGVEMLQRARLDADRSDERIDLAFLQTDHSAELVRREVALVDELVQRAEGDAKPFGGVCGAEPADLTRHRAHGSRPFLSAFPHERSLFSVAFKSFHRVSMVSR
jgi:hypothetical protein